MQVIKFECSNCGYSSSHELGTPDMDQTLSDVNTEFFQYKLFVCTAEKRFVDMDVMNPDFSGKCPVDSTPLVRVENVYKARCPNCGSSLAIGNINPLTAATGESE